MTVRWPIAGIRFSFLTGKLTSVSGPLRVVCWVLTIDPLLLFRFLNLVVLKRSRPRLKVGDVFAMQPPDRKFLFGQVISTDAKIGPITEMLLLYIYRVRAESKLPVPELSPRELLIPPVITNRRPWTMGYFETLESRPVGPEDMLPTHCFRHVSGRFFDESGNRLAQPVEPIGSFGLHSFRTIDDEVSEALGIPLAPD